MHRTKKWASVSLFPAAGRGQIADLLISRAEIDQGFFGKGQHDQRHAAGQSIALKTRRNRERREIEQVGEVGVAAELLVKRDRIGLDLGER